MDERRTSTNESEDKKTNDYAQGLYPGGNIDRLKKRREKRTCVIY